ncbi:MAG: succinate dehydrogenase, cytochrome b556 subunit [Bacillota bacterium]
MSSRRHLSELRGNSDLYPRNVRAGMYAWLFHRITGLALVFYIILHIFVIASVNFGGGSFDSTMRLLTSKPFVIVDLVLVGVVLYHGLNGLRIIFFDLGYGIKNQRSIFWALMAVGTVIFVFAAYASSKLLFRA